MLLKSNVIKSDTVSLYYRSLTDQEKIVIDEFIKNYKDYIIN